MIKKNYRIKKTISMKQFIAEFGEDFSEHMKKRLLELEIRSVLTRKEDINKLDLKHVEHTKYDFKNNENSSETCKKEYAFGQFIVQEGTLYFSDRCLENVDVMESNVVNTIYNSLNDDGMITYNESNAKVVNDDNIDYVIDTLLTAFPPVSQRYREIMKGIICFEKK